MIFAPYSPEDARSVLVVGAGPAGATAARTLARAGVKVRLLDRAAFPRNKPCGGGISLRVLPRFPYLESALPRISTHQVSRLYLEAPDGQSTVIESEGPAALMIRRVEFDALLVALAQEAGAELVTGADIVQAREERDRVVVTARDGRSFAAPVVIAADGVNSAVARRLGLNPGWPPSSMALDMMEETPRTALRDVDPTMLWVAYGYRGGTDKSDVQNGRACSTRGYAYIFPKLDHVNIGVGYVLSDFKQRIERAPYDLQREFVEHLEVRGVVVGRSVRENFTPFLIPVGGPLRRPGRGRVLLAGDAGGFVNAFTAEGIYYAMVSGDLAARTVVQSNGFSADLATRYRRACDYEIGIELRESVIVQRYLFGDIRRIGQIVNGAHREVAITRLILDLATGKRSYRDVRWRVFVHAPLAAGRFAWEWIKSAAAL